MDPAQPWAQMVVVRDGVIAYVGLETDLPDDVTDVIELDMSVDEALTYVISMGAVSPSVLPGPPH